MMKATDKPFTAKEAEELYGELCEGLYDYCQALDWALSHANRNHAQAEIWSAMDDDDLGALADLLILRGQRSARAAVMVKHIIEFRYYLTSGVLTVDKVIESIAFIAHNGGLWLPPIQLGFLFGSAKPS